MEKRKILAMGTFALATSLYFLAEAGRKEDAGSKGPFIAASSEDKPFTAKQGRASGDSRSPIEPKMESSKDNSANLANANSSEYDRFETLEKVSELHKELMKLGYFIPLEYVASYESYTEDALLQMAEYGDMVAIKALKNRYSAAEQWEAYRAMQEEAVLQGSIADISDLHDIELSNYSGEDSRDRLIKSAAYAELAALRGSDITINYAITNFNEMGVELSPSELAQIRKMAKDMLDQINVERRSRGKEALEKIDESLLTSLQPDSSMSGGWWGLGVGFNP